MHLTLQGLGCNVPNENVKTCFPNLKVTRVHTQTRPEEIRRDYSGGTECIQAKV